MKQANGTFVSVANVASTFADKNSSLGRNTAYYTEKSFNNLFPVNGMK